MQRCKEARELVRKKSRTVLPILAVVGPEKDVRLKEYCEDRAWAWIGGDEHDLFERYMTAMHRMQASGLVRITSDCWNIEPGMIARATLGLVQADYISNTITRSFEEGQDVQAAKRRAFEWISEHTHQNREHPFFEFDFNIRMRRSFKYSGFVIDEIRNTENIIYKKNSIDTIEDLSKARQDYEIRCQAMARENELRHGAKRARNE